MWPIDVNKTDQWDGVQFCTSTPPADDSISDIIQTQMSYTSKAQMRPAVIFLGCLGRAVSGNKNVKS